MMFAYRMVYDRTGLRLEIIWNHISHLYNYLMISCICIELIEHRLMKTKGNIHLMKMGFTFSVLLCITIMI